MKHKKQLRLKPIIIGLASICYIVPVANAVLINEDFTKGQTTQKWYMPLPGGGMSYDPASRPSFNSACLTSRAAPTTGTARGAYIDDPKNPKAAANPGTPGSPGKCAGANDEDGKGALRLTPAKSTSGRHRFY